MTEAPATPEPTDAVTESGGVVAAPPGGYVEVVGLSVRAGGAPLLSQVDLRVGAGELVLLVGGSGTGKSVLLSVMAGLVGAADGVEVEGQVRHTGRVGMVFQQGALFEGMSLAGNMRFALDHASPKAGAEVGERLLEQVRIPAELALPSASGGQRRRIAIARALANQPEILLYDEPTAGLDPDLARHVAALIRQTHDGHGTATLVVTHDFVALAPVADRIVFLDPTTRGLREVSADELAELVEAGAFRAVPADGAAAAPPLVLRPLAAVGRAVLAGLGAILASLLPRWRRPRWGAGALGRSLWLVGGPTSMAYVALAGAVVGCVAVYFSFRYLPFARYLRPLVTEDLLAAIGFALYRVLVPILATTLIAARCGAAVASDLAGRAYRQELAAARTLGAHPGGLWGFASLMALTLATPVLVLVSFAVARWVALATYGLWDPAMPAAQLGVHFHAKLVEDPGLLYHGTGWLLAKSLTCGLVIGLTAVALALPPKRRPDEVSAAVTRTVLVATALVLLVHFVYAFVEFQGLGQG